MDKYSFNYQEIYKSYFSLIEGVKREYSFLKISGKDYTNLVKKGILMSIQELQENANLEFKISLLNNLRFLYKKILKEELRDNSYGVLNNYFNSICINISDYKVFLEGLTKVLKFLKEEEIILKSSLTDRLIQENKSFYLLGSGLYRYRDNLKNEHLKDININVISLSYYVEYKLEVESLKEKKNLYLRYKDYTKEEVDLGLSSLTKSDRDLISFRYTKDGDYIPKKIDQESTKRLSYLLREMLPSILKKQKLEKKRMAIEGLFLVEERHLVREAILWLPSRYQGKVKYLSQMYYQYKDKILEDNEFREVIYPLLKKYLVFIKYLKNNDSKEKHIKSIYEIFREYQKKDVLLVVSNLSKKEKDLLGLKYKKDLYPKEEYHLSEEENKALERLIYGKMNRLLKKGLSISRVNNNLLDKLDYYSKEEVITVIEALSLEERRLLGLRFTKEGDTKEDYHFLDQNTKAKINNLIYNKITNMLKRNRKLYNLGIIMYLKNNYLLNRINISLNDDYIYMLLLKYGRVDKEYSEQEIASLCGYKKEEVEKLLEFFRNSYHKDKEMTRKLHL